MDILIFRTNATTKWDFNLIKNLLFDLPDIYDCTIDLNDSDRVLRVITDKHSPQSIVSKIKLLGYYCEELED